MGPAGAFWVRSAKELKMSCVCGPGLSAARCRPASHAWRVVGRVNADALNCGVYTCTRACVLCGQRLLCTHCCMH